VAYIFWTEKARQALAARQYPQAEQLASQSLRLRPDQPKAFHVLAQAKFAQANFSGAAAAYRKILEVNSSHTEIVALYAQALAAADRRTAVTEFRTWADTLKGERPREVNLAAAGLSLLAGDAEPGRKLESELQQSGETQAPLLIGQLGWWNYWDGNYQKALDLLSEATQQRPGDTKLGLRLAWAMIEVRRYGDALQTLEIAVYQQPNDSERAMARAVTRWQAQEHDQALIDFNAAVGGQPEWGNLDWVRSLYSPLVTQSIREMQAERERRRSKNKPVASR
jgi:tetratricopeptide (TPR) repeat protein